MSVSAGGRRWRVASIHLLRDLSACLSAKDLRTADLSSSKTSPPFPVETCDEVMATTCTIAEATIVPAATATLYWSGEETDIEVPQAAGVQEAARASPVVRSAVGAENGQLRCGNALFLSAGFGLIAFVTMLVYWVAWSPYA